jgi:hypothetical protein
MKFQQTTQLDTGLQPGILQETFRPIPLNAITFFCGKKECCRKYKKRGKKRCKKCPDLN